MLQVEEQDLGTASKWVAEFAEGSTCAADDVQHEKKRVELLAFTANLDVLDAAAGERPLGTSGGTASGWCWTPVEYINVSVSVSKKSAA